MVVIASVLLLIGILTVACWVVMGIVYVIKSRSFKRESEKMDREWDVKKDKMSEAKDTMDYAYAERQRRRRENRSDSEESGE